MTNHEEIKFVPSVAPFVEAARKYGVEKISCHSEGDIEVIEQTVGRGWPGLEYNADSVKLSLVPFEAVIAGRTAWGEPEVLRKDIEYQGIYLGENGALLAEHPVVQLYLGLREKFGEKVELHITGSHADWALREGTQLEAVEADGHVFKMIGNIPTGSPLKAVITLPHDAELEWSVEIGREKGIQRLKIMPESKRSLVKEFVEEVTTERPGAAKAFVTAAQQYAPRCRDAEKPLDLRCESRDDGTQVIVQKLEPGSWPLALGSNGIEMTLTPLREEKGLPVFNTSTTLSKRYPTPEILTGREGMLTRDHPIAQLFFGLRETNPEVRIHIITDYGRWRPMKENELTPDEQGNLCGKVPAGSPVKALITGVEGAFDHGGWKEGYEQRLEIRPGPK